MILLLNPDVIDVLLHLRGSEEPGLCKEILSSQFSYIQKFL